MGENKYKSFDFIEEILESLEKQFPKECSCGKKYESFKQFLLQTRLPSPQNIQIFDCYEIHEIFTLRNCGNCQSTISVKCLLEKKSKEKLLRAIQEDITKYNMDEDEFLQIFRDEVLKYAYKKYSIDRHER